MYLTIIYIYIYIISIVSYTLHDQLISNVSHKNTKIIDFFRATLHDANVDRWKLLHFEQRQFDGEIPGGRAAPCGHPGGEALLASQALIANHLGVMYGDVGRNNGEL